MEPRPSEPTDTASQSPHSASLLAAVFDALPHPVFVKDASRRYVLVNDGYCALTGRARLDMLYRTDADLFPADQAMQTQKRDERVLAEHRRYEAEELMVDVAGRHHRILLNIAPMAMPDGGYGIVGTIADVTHRRRIERQLRDSREHLARAQRVAAIGSFERNIVTGRGAFSDEALRIVGLADARDLERVPEEVLLLFHEEDRPLIAAAAATVLKGEPQPPFDARIARPDGTMRVVHLTYGPTRNEDGDIVGFMGSIQDVTDFRRLEAERLALEKQLHHAQRLEALGTLAGGIAHDLNNTLVPVLNLPKLVMRELPEDSGGRASLLLIEQAGRRARQLVQRILDFSRRQVPNKGPFRLDRMVRDGLPLLRATLPASLRIEERIAEVPPVLGDQEQIFQILLNLMVNAAQAIGDQPGRIEIGVAQAATALADGAWEGVEPSIILTVRDDGPGMDEQTRQRIFEPFFTTKPVGGGSGLGLSVVHGIVAAHGGRIEVASAPGEGAAFVVHLPCAAMPDGDASLAEEPMR